MGNHLSTVAALLFFAFTASLVHCSKNNTDSTSTGQTAGNLTQGNWQVQYFYDDRDETIAYIGYVFTFSNDGTLSLTNGVDSAGGGWEVTQDGSKQKLVLNIVSNTLLQNLNDDWEIESSSKSFIKLKDQNTSSKHSLHLKRK